MKNWRDMTFDERQRFVTACNQLLNEMREASALYDWRTRLIADGRAFAAQWCAEHPPEPPTAYDRWLSQGRS